MSLEIALAIVAVMGSIWVLARQFPAARLKQGQFSVERDDSRTYRFRTDLGSFVIDRAHRVFRSLLDDESRAIPLDNLERLTFTYSEEESVGWLMNKTCWYRIAVVAAGRTMPVFAVGRVLGGTQGDADLDLPAEWFPDPDRKAREVLQELWNAFRASGRSLSAPGGATIRAAE